VVVGPDDPVEPVKSPVDPVPVGPVKSPVDPVPVEPVKSPVEPVPVGPVKSPVEPVPVGPVNSMETGDMVDPVPGDPADGKSEKPVVEGPVNPSSQTTSALSATGLEMKQYSRPSLS